DVLGRLRELAKREAECLLREYKSQAAFHTNTKPTSPDGSSTNGTGGVPMRRNRSSTASGSVVHTSPAMAAILRSSPMRSPQINGTPSAGPALPNNLSALTPAAMPSGAAAISAPAAITKKSLPEISEQLSRVILRVSDLVEKALAQNPTDASTNEEDETNLLHRLVYNYVPPSLQSLPDFRDRLRKIPAQYRKWIVAKTVATRIVYGEGIAFVDRLGSSSVDANGVAIGAGEEAGVEGGNVNRIGKLAIKYLEEQERVAGIVGKLREIPDVGGKLEKALAEEVAGMLVKYGAKAVLEDQLRF
ncbi:hypothetical protein HK102_013009, partial [Quaeritorhiza haematococci]